MYVYNLAKLQVGKVLRKLWCYPYRRASSGGKFSEYYRSTPSVEPQVGKFLRKLYLVGAIPIVEPQVGNFLRNF